ncbi:MAG: FIST C-terminal domain-containing protein [Ectothiorhodospiraceae bacterium]|nr:FIST C-terminal domain-containing protein [Ectothiorhodospiraceae bacterium]
MDRFLGAHVFGTEPARLVDEIAFALGPLPATANFGFLYASDALSSRLPVILPRLKDVTGIEHWIGSVGVGLCVGGEEIYDRPALAAMVGGFPADAFRVLPSCYDAADTPPADIAAWAGGHAAHFGLIHGDPSNPATPELIRQLADSLPGAFLTGGLTSSQGLNFQFADEPVQGGISGALFAETVAVIAGHTQGCTPIGPKHRITAAQRNIVIELDGRPAFEVMREDIGEVLARDLNRIGGYIFAGLPVAGSDTGDYLVRNLMGVDTTRGLVAIGDLAQEGGSLMFCRRDGNTAREDMLRMLEDLRARGGGDARGAVYVSCLGRGRHQFGEDSEELKLVREVLGDLPLVGFFANGEIFHNRLYGYTGVLSVFL